MTTEEWKTEKQQFLNKSFDGAKEVIEKQMKEVAENKIKRLKSGPATLEDIIPIPRLVFQNSSLTTSYCPKKKEIGSDSESDRYEESIFEEMKTNK